MLFDKKKTTRMINSTAPKIPSRFKRYENAKNAKGTEDAGTGEVGDIRI